MGIPKRVDAKRSEQARKCYELDLAGFSQRQIAEKVGISQTTVHNRLVEHVQNRVHRKADEWRDRQLDDLMVLRRKLVGAIESGDIKAIAAAVRIWERISKLLGTDSATSFKVEVQPTNDTLEVHKIMEHFFGSDAQNPATIPGEVVRRPRTERPPLTYAAPPANEFAKEPDATEEFDIEDIHTEPHPAPRPRRRGKPVPNPADQFLRDSDD